MPVVLRAHGLRFVIYVDDHEPAHVHVRGDGEARIAIGSATDPPHMLSADAMKSSVQRRALRTVAENQTLFLLKWAELHGGHQ